MNFYSTRDLEKTQPATLEEAVMRGLAPDGGLYMPETITALPPSFFDEIETLTLQEINYRVASHLIGASIPGAVLRKITDEALNFPTPLVEIEPGIFTLELFHGPTMAFKDVGARFMARLMGHFVEGQDSALKVIVATSGDTGGAVAAGFFQVPGIEVCILYPSGKVSPLQEKQLTTWGGNIKAIEVDGNFDDCQKLAKQVLGNTELNGNGSYTSANSINIARLIPQSLYYFHAYRQAKKYGKPVIVSVPSGNFGNLTAGLLAQKMGLPIAHFIAATNANDTVPAYLKSGTYAPRPSVATISNAMDVGDPSNFERMLQIFGGDALQFSSGITGLAYSDEETKVAMRSVHGHTGYMLDPHGAVGYLGLRDFLAEQESDYTGIILGTAHPVKFLEVVESTLSTALELPEKMLAFANKDKVSVKCPNDFNALRAILEAE